jgi:hypothetical protein
MCGVGPFAVRGPLPEVHEDGNHQGRQRWTVGTSLIVKGAS